MADTSIGSSFIKCGFFNAKRDINGKPDRTYTADEMNLPYKDLISDGILSTDKNKNQTTNFKVYSVNTVGAGYGNRTITITGGKGIFAGKWFVLSAPIEYEVPANTNVSARKDKVIIRINESHDVREGSMIYRTGSSDGTPASVINSAGITEYAIAEVTVYPGALIINDANIRDLRGLDHPNGTPWIASFIQTLSSEQFFKQWENMLDTMVDMIGDNIATWSSALEADHENYLALVSASFKKTIGSATNHIEITHIEFPALLTYDDTREYFTPIVTVNNYLLTRDRTNGATIDGDYRMDVFNAGTSSPTINFIFKNNILPGSKVSITLLHSVTAYGVPGLTNSIEALEENFERIEPRGYSQTLTLRSGVSRDLEIADSEPKVGTSAGAVFLRGIIHGFTPIIGNEVATIPQYDGDNFPLRPQMDWYFTSISNIGSITFKVAANTGIISIFYTTCPQSSENSQVRWPIFTSWHMRMLTT